MAERIFPHAIPLAEFLSVEEEPYDWAIPDILERQDRLILTGFEGNGKTTLLRQIMLQVGHGIHPFTLQPMPPLRVLFVDLENPERLARRLFQSIVDRANVSIPGGSRIIAFPEGINLSDPTHLGWLQREISDFYPELVIIGPIYKLSYGNPVLEQEALPVAKALDFLRTTYNFALILEAHCPYQQGETARPTRPYGWSGWSRWPEFGYHIAKEGHLKPYRPPRDERNFPEELVRGGVWPWTSDSANLYTKACAYAQQIGRKPTDRELQQHLGVPRSTIQRRLKGTDWSTRFSPGPLGPNGVGQPDGLSAATSGPRIHLVTGEDPLQE